MFKSSLYRAGRTRPVLTRLRKTRRALSGRLSTAMVIFAALGACAEQAETDDEKVVLVEVSAQGLITPAKLATGITSPALVTVDGGVAVPRAVPGGTCIGVASNRTDNGAPIVKGICDGSAGQQWTLTEAGQLKNPSSGRCLDVTGGANFPADGTPLQLWDCTGASNQKWAFTVLGLQSNASAKCATISPTAADGTAVVVRLCFGSLANSQSLVREFSILKGDGSQRCLDMRAGNTAERAPVTIRDCTAGFNQSWFSESAWTAPGADRIFTTGAYNGSLTWRCLTASGTDSGSIATVEPCVSSDLQRWRRTDSGRLVSVASNRCLEVANGSTANGAAVRIGDCRSLFNSHQLWGTR